MSNNPGILDRIEGSRLGGWVIRPIVAVCFYALAGVAFIVAVCAFWIAFQQSQHSVNQANRAASAAVAKANATHTQQVAAQRVQGEVVRAAFCNIVTIYSKASGKITGAPTPVQQSVFGAWKALGDTPALHCYK